MKLKNACQAPTTLVLTALLVAILALTACQAPTGRTPQAYTSEPSLQQKAERAVQAAQASTGLERTGHLLDAATYFQTLGQADKVLETLKALDATQLSGAALGQYTSLYAPLLLAQHKHFQARDLLTASSLESALTTLPVELHSDLRRQRGDLFSLLGEDRAAITEYVTLSRLAGDASEIRETHDKIWKILSHTPGSTLQAQSSNAQGADVQGWYQLALAARGLGDVSQQQNQIAQWRQRWSTHPANIHPPANLDIIISGGAASPTQVALLLPLTGSYGEAGSVIRDGFLAAYYDSLGQGGTTPLVKIYDTTTGSTTDLYQQAVAEGAQVTIGPLRKQNLAALKALPELPVPVIGLNYLDEDENSGLDVNPNTRPANLFQFGLSIADEAKQVAERAWLEGRRAAYVMTPDTDWGERARAAFREHWLSRGGTLVNTPPYALSQTDFTTIIKPGMLLEQSAQRAKKIQRTLGKNIESEPRRRHDIDMIFLVALPAQGRSIKPTLDFFYAHDLPVYATSHIYANSGPTHLNQDLEGIRFSAMPWTLPGMVSSRLLPDERLRASYRHLYALGIDAYQLYQRLAMMQAAPGMQLYGHTGTLTLAADNTIQRTQPWARFSGNSVRAAAQLRAD